jgi:bifunctional ADP-heptose synthase (sugar kinase/adenylyltransferase)
MAGEGAVLVDENGKVCQSEAPKGKVVNSVGAGDSMVAGFIYGYLNYQDYAEAFRYGLATGSASAFKEELATKEVSAGVLVSKNDALTLRFLRENYENYKKSNDQLAEVLGELVKMLDLDGTGVDVYLLQYVAHAMDALRWLIEEIKDIEYDWSNNE